MTNNTLDQALSSFWRTRRSQDRSIELRDLQDQLTYLARLVSRDSNTQVVWSKETSPNKDTWKADADIILDSSAIDALDKKAIIPDSVVDNLFGDVLYRAYLKRLKNNDKFHEADSRWRVAMSGVGVDNKTMQVGYETIKTKRGRMRTVPIIVANPLYEMDAMQASRTPIGQVRDVLEHMLALAQTADAPPAARQYVDKSRQWKREAAHGLIGELSERVSQENVTIKDALDFWGTYLTYDCDIPEEINEQLGEAIVEASGAIADLVRKDKIGLGDALGVYRRISEAFAVFPDKLPEPEPPESPPMGSPESQDEGEAQDSQPSDSGEQGEGSEQKPSGSQDNKQDESTDSGAIHEGGDNESSNEGEDSQDESSADQDSDESEEEDEDNSSDEDSDWQDWDNSSESDDDSEDEQDNDEAVGTPESSKDESQYNEEYDEDEMDESSEYDSEAADEGDYSEDEGTLSGTAVGEFDELDEDAELDEGEGGGGFGADTMQALREQAEEKSVLESLDLVSQLNQDEIDAIKDAIEKAKEDITEELAQHGHNTFGSPVYWQKGVYDANRERELLDLGYKQATGISNVLRRFQRMRSRYEHGRPEGTKLDRRRLYRVGAGNMNVFERRTVIDKLDMSLTLLVDASSSVYEENWNLMQQVVAGFVQAFRGKPEVDLMAMSYTASNGLFGRGDPHYTMARIWDRKMNHLCAVREEAGGTPSDIGLAAVRNVIYDKLRIRHRDKVVIHLTDGAANDMNALAAEVERCRQQGIEVYCILISNQYTYDAYKSQFELVYGLKRFKHLTEYRNLLPVLTDLFEKITETR